eukprot:gi/632983954/ref/XP_007908902.1/ PREDICTED: trafficking kinesin-binding protein 1-like [Callorhinchus milii]
MGESLEFLAAELWSSAGNECIGNVGENSEELMGRDIEEVLCADRVGQVTKTYHDIEAVTHLLEEKERDLELAARIGQSLLKQNHSLTQRNEVLEEQLQQTLEEISQLKHELLMRDDLLQLYTDTTEDSDPNPTHSTALPWNASASSLHSFVQLDFLQQKLQGLEEENSRLRHQVPVGPTHPDTHTPHRLSNNQLAMVSEELARKVEDCTRQQEEISRLLAHIVNLKQKCKACTTENEELSQHMASLRGSREQLKSELWELKERYAECKGFLQEAQEEIKNLRNKCMPNSSINRYHTVPVFPMDSIAAEIEGTMRKGLHGDSAALLENVNCSRRVFETVRAANQAGKSRSQLPQNIPGSSHSSAAPSRVSSRITTPRTSFYGSESSIEVAEDKTPSLNDENKDAERKLGTPGTPGCRDLEVALQRLSLSRESSCYESEREHKLTILASDGPASPADSFLSIGTNYSGSSGFSLSSRSLLPEKLKIVKPLEGSVTLHHWQQLAQPHFGGLLESRPGVLTKDFQLLELDMEQVYNLADLEEDEADMALYQKLLSLPTDPSPNSQGYQSGNLLPATQYTCTITTCRILHPLDEMSVVTSSPNYTSIPSCGNLDTLKPTTVRPAPSYGNLTTMRSTPSYGNLTTMRSTPSCGSFDTLRPIPSYGNLTTMRSTPSCGSFDTLRPIPSYGNLTTMRPTPSYGNLTTMRSTPSCGSFDTLRPIPSYGNFTTMRPTPSCGSFDTLGPVPSYGKSDTLRSTLSCGNLTTLRPIPSCGNFDTVRPIPSCGFDTLRSKSAYGKVDKLRSTTSCGNFNALRPTSSYGNFEPLRFAHRTPRQKRYPSESSTNSREHTTTMSTSLGLVTLLKEHGISAAVYNPASWDTGKSVGQNDIIIHYQPGDSLSSFPQPGAQVIHSSASPFGLQLISLTDRPFLTSSMARSMMKEVSGVEEQASLNKSKAEKNIFSFNLVEKLKRLGLDKVVERGVVPSENKAVKRLNSTSSRETVGPVVT